MLLKLDYAGDVPIYQQIRNQIVLGIAAGELPPGGKLPTIRALATELGINMMTVSKAYQILRQEGYICADRRNGAWVSERAGDGRAIGKLEDALALIAAEARLNGVPEDALVALCRKFYREGEENGLDNDNCSAGNAVRDDSPPVLL